MYRLDVLDDRHHRTTMWDRFLVYADDKGYASHDELRTLILTDFYGIEIKNTPFIDFPDEASLLLFKLKFN